MNRILGIVAEYNPFHLGHDHQLKTAKAETGCDYTVIAMSGNFVQRGEPAVFDKWTRAGIAVDAGADLVLEIPTWFVLQSAEGFARAGIALLSCCGINHLSFGSESGSAAGLVCLANWLDRRETQHRIKIELQQGITYAAAVQRAAESDPDICELAPVLSGANDILAIEYIRAVHCFAPGLDIHPVRRIGQDRAGYASASALRQKLAAGKAAQAREHIPQCAWAAFTEAVENRVFTRDFSQAMFYALLTLEARQIQALPACSEGLENRIKNFLPKYRSIGELIQAVKTKRYPRTRIQRLLMQILLQFHKTPASGSYAPYLRVLACSARGKELLPVLARLGKAPLIFSARDMEKLDNPARQLLNLDQRAADVYSLAQKSAVIVKDICRMPVGT